MQELETISLPHSLVEFSSIIDVRSPIEFTDDHLPGAVNLPVLSDEQRVEVGTLHKHDPFSARILGARYISVNCAEHLRTLEQTWSRDHQPLLYCWRGGLRSHSFTHILRSVGWRARLLEGGYKSYRKYVLSNFREQLAGSKATFYALTGLTGTGKTRLLSLLKQAGAQVLDLEGLANHRGSLLGSQGPQPSQKLFEGKLHEALSQLDHNQPIYIEAESNRIGQRSIPAALWQKLHSAVVTEVRLPLTARAQLLLEDYPRFLSEPVELCSLLDKLRPLRGHEQVDHWHTLIAEKDWISFLQSILGNHYDLCYRPAGGPKSNYQKPSRILDIEDHSEASFQKATETLLNL